MITTLQLLDELKRVRKLPSDYAAAKYLGISQQAVSKWRTGSPMGEDMAEKIAFDLELDIDIVMLSNMAERRKHKREEFKKSSSDAA
ncbi:hypothetical protein [Photobacterium halotolerans]|uniref:HTH cro/C1-type domain-containing protein n=1 Tax=Photobacterium halotolerans TaxID=265726 RepID=A0A7X4WFW9_9GAMM|nr:hypothetical protein [Photobacterium halotolerans]NAW67657.1 hypothetical protein [Photobacterium halotolerans]